VTRDDNDDDDCCQLLRWCIPWWRPSSRRWPVLPTLTTHCQRQSRRSSSPPASLWRHSVNTRFSRRLPPRPRDTWSEESLDRQTDRHTDTHKHRWYWWQQESLTNAKVSARQRRVCEGPSERNLRQINARNIMLKSTFSMLQRCRWRCGSIFIRLAVVVSQICEIPRNSLKILTYKVQGHPRSSTLVPIEYAYTTFY